MGEEISGFVPAGAVWNVLAHPALIAGGEHFEDFLLRAFRHGGQTSAHGGDGNLHVRVCCCKSAGSGVRTRYT